MHKNFGKPFKLNGFAVKSHKENGIAITGAGAFESLPLHQNSAQIYQN